MELKQIVDDIYDKLGDLKDHPDFEGTIAFLVRKNKLNSVSSSSQIRQISSPNEDSADHIVRHLIDGLQEDNQNDSKYFRILETLSYALTAMIGCGIGYFLANLLLQ